MLRPRQPLLLLLSSLGSVPPPILGLKDVTIESFRNPEQSHVWYSLSDPVMGGQSTATFVVSSDDGGVGVFEGEVKDVPSLSAPGFVAVRTGRGGFFPDVSSCDGLRLTVRSKDAYAGYRLNFGTNSAPGSSWYVRGYKARFDVPASDAFQDVVMNFTEFSDSWDPKTGDVVVSCEEDEQFCPDEATLKSMYQMEVMAEGVNGKIKLEIQSIVATNCDDDVIETDPHPDETAKRGSGRGRFGNNDMSGYLNRDENSVGGYGGYMYPTILPGGDVRIESFDDPRHRWYPINDPVMGGSSTSTVTIKKNVGVFDGEVVDVGFLGAPGFIKMETRGGNFPDVSMCKALRITLKSSNDYNGIRLSMGTHHAKDSQQPYIRGYKTRLTGAPVNRYGEVVIPFNEFSDKWDPRTGDIITSCKEDKTRCVDERTLKDMQIFSFMGEGVDGKVHLEIKSIDATDCKHSKEEYQSLDAAYTDGDVGVGTLGVIGMTVGFIAVSALAFIVGRRYERKSSNPTASVIVESPSVQGSEQGVELESHNTDNFIS